MRSILLVILSLGLAAAAGADVLETRDGRILEGVYKGGTQQAVRFEIGGRVDVIPRAEVLAITFVPDHSGPAAQAPQTTPPQTQKRAAAPTKPAKAAANKPAKTTSSTVPAPTASANPPAAPPPAAAAPAPKIARVPAGTRLQVRVIDSIDAKLATQGDAFAATLESGLGMDGVAIVPGGSKVYGRVAELRETGPIEQRMKLELTGLMVQGQLLELVTGSQTPTAPPASADPAAAAAAGRGDVPAGTAMEFRLLQPFELRLQ